MLMTNSKECKLKHWKKIGKRDYRCPEYDEMLTLGVPIK